MTKRRFSALALLLAAALLLASCGSGKGSASAMRLRKAEGSVRVSDSKGQDLDVLDDLQLSAGYDLRTRDESYAWIALDETNLVKMDQETRAEIQQDGGDLEIAVKYGSLFFHITEPLGDDETLSIRTSTMAADIRGTCGWVEVPEDEGIMRVYLLEGRVECTADGTHETILAGEMATLTEDGDITAEDFSVRQIPAFVMEELTEDEDLAEAILDDSGLDIWSEDADPCADALEQYRAVISQPASYYDSEYDDSTGDYRYALAMMQTEYDVPALLLEQDTYFGISNILVFQYDPAGETVVQADGIMGQGAGSAGGYRGYLSAAGDGNGLLDTSWSSGTGMGGTSRVTLSGNTLQWESLWEGNVMMDTDTATEAIGSRDIGWHDVGDPSGLDSWAPGAAPIPGDTGEPDGADHAEAGLPTDGDWTVLTGTIVSYTDEELIAFQEVPESQATWLRDGRTYWIAVLDAPQTIMARNGDGDGSRESEARLIDLTEAAGLEYYEGQHVIFSIDPDATWWPSDASLPLGEPRTSDVHILG